MSEESVTARARVNDRRSHPPGGCQFCRDADDEAVDALAHSFRPLAAAIRAAGSRRLVKQRGEYVSWGRRCIANAAFPDSAHANAAAAWLASLEQNTGGRLTYSSYLCLPVFEAVGVGDGESLWDRAHVIQLASVLLQDIAGEGTLMAETFPAEICARTAEPLSRAIHGLWALSSTVLPEVCTPSLKLVALLSLIPASPEPLEALFVRVVQVSELLFAIVLSDLTAALREAGNGRRREMRGFLRRAAMPWRVMPSLFRLLNTMTGSEFAVIREHTMGASALQSARYHQLHQLAQACAAAVTRLEDSFAHAALVDLERQYATWKRIHLATTRRLIGGVRGTGDTEGAAYLERALATPMFDTLPVERVQGE